MRTENSNSVNIPLPSDAPICPLSRMIFLNPVKLLPIDRENWNVGTAIVEKEVWDEFVHSNSSSSAICPNTRIPVSGYITSYEMKEAIYRYLSEHPEQKENQYKQKKTINAVAQPSDSHSIIGSNELDEEAQVLLPISPAANLSLIRNQTVSEPRSLSTSMQALIMDCWKLDCCKPDVIDPVVAEAICKALGFSALTLFWTFTLVVLTAPMNSLTTRLGASTLGYDEVAIESAGDATGVGSALVFGVCGLVFSLCIYIPTLYPSISSSSMRSRSEARLAEIPFNYSSINAGTIFGAILLVTCLEVGISIIGQQILHGGSDDKLSLSQLAKASALGISFFSIPVSICGVCTIKGEEERRNQMRSR